VIFKEVGSSSLSGFGLNYLCYQFASSLRTPRFLWGEAIQKDYPSIIMLHINLIILNLFLQSRALDSHSAAWIASPHKKRGVRNDEVIGKGEWKIFTEMTYCWYKQYDSPPIAFPTGMD